MLSAMAQWQTASHPLHLHALLFQASCSCLEWHPDLVLQELPPQQLLRHHHQHSDAAAAAFHALQMLPKPLYSAPLRLTVLQLLLRETLQDSQHCLLPSCLLQHLQQHTQHLLLQLLLLLLVHCLG
jgi:hypothetical protein